MPGENMADKKVGVILNTPGVVCCGSYLPGVKYSVEKKEAARLVTVKGFKYVEEVKHVTN
ncbi:MAG: hypothetical protein Tp1111SUR522732_17 [Prokaryotic dsDNA virus sp.]|nr:MAG: hypothetical protein Tp1111SUR522732_17 [Prokaryotic dsDNA virus sp.]|tara:strand:- start:4330 stop:4509 length:180 start_codon:yes stop_codon:yes gene_type:complete